MDDKKATVPIAPNSNHLSRSDPSLPPIGRPEPPPPLPPFFPAVLLNIPKFQSLFTGGLPDADFDGVDAGGGVDVGLSLFSDVDDEDDDGSVFFAVAAAD